MRDVNASIDSVKDPATKAALRRLLAATLAAQAVAAAAAQDFVLDGGGEVRGWIEAVAGYPGVTMTKIDDGHGSATIGDLAEEIGRRLVDARPK